MAETVSMVVMEDEIYWDANTDDHSAMISDLGLRDTEENDKFVRVEVVPPYLSDACNRNYAADPKDWRIKIDQDYLPPWWFKGCQRDRILAEVVQWQKQTVINDSSKVHSVPSGRRFVYGGSTLMLGHLASATVYDGRVEAYGDSSIVLYGKSTAYVGGKSNVTMFDESSAVVDFDGIYHIHGVNNKVTARGRSQGFFETPGTARIVLENSAILIVHFSNCYVESLSDQAVLINHLDRLPTTLTGRFVFDPSGIGPEPKATDIPATNPTPGQDDETPEKLVLTEEPESCNCDTCVQAREILEDQERKCESCGYLVKDCECSTCEHCGYKEDDCECDWCSHCERKEPDCECSICEHCKEKENDCECSICEFCSLKEGDCECEHCADCTEKLHECTCTDEPVQETSGPKEPTIII